VLLLLLLLLLLLRSAFIPLQQLHPLRIARIRVLVGRLRAFLKHFDRFFVREMLFYARAR